MVGNAGSVEIEANSLTISDGGFVSSSTNGQGNAGNITLNIDDAVTLTNDADIFSDVDSNAITEEGTRSTVAINAGSLSIADAESSISASTLGQGNAGNINLNITNTTELNSGNIFSQVTATGVGEGGSITLNTNNLSLLDGSQITAGVFGTGDAGIVTVNASGDITFQGVNPNSGNPSGILSNVAEGGAGDAGDTVITTTNLNLIDGGSITSDVSGEGNAGDIQVNTATLSLINGGRISSNVFGTGNAGSITIDASESINISGFTDFDGSSRFSQVSSLTGSNVMGDAGSIKINANSLTISDGGFVSSSTFGEGNSGQIDITTQGSIELTNSTIESSTFGTGNGGTITINAEDLTLDNQAGIFAETAPQQPETTLQPEETTPSEINLFIDNTLTLKGNSTISAEAANSADGGNININAGGFVVAFPSEGTGSDIRANAAEGGSGGEINISTQQILGLSEAEGTSGLENNSNDIDASSEDGTLNGEVTLSESDTSIVQGATELPTNIIEPNQSVAQACSNNQDRGIASNFVIKGRGGVPSSPTAPLNSETITVNGDVATNSNSHSPISTSIGEITLARGVIKTADGKIILTPNPVSGDASRTAHGALNCG